MFRSTDDSHSWDVVEHAIKSGINWIDGAPWYGHGKAEIVFGEVSLLEYFGKALSPF